MEESHREIDIQPISSATVNSSTISSENKDDQVRNEVIVAAALIAVATYQALLSPPEAISIDDIEISLARIVGASHIMNSGVVSISIIFLCIDESSWGDEGHLRSRGNDDGAVSAQEVMSSVSLGGKE
ncbi:hypothetical protein Tco_1358784 [Tanacetum coccineum]